MSDENISSSIETERKYDVGVSTVVPTIVGFRTAAVREADALHAIYYDTPNGALAANAIALRLRTGGHDDGWHLKKMTGQGERVEYHASVSSDPPAGLLALVNHITQGPLIAIAVIDTQRATTLVTDAEGKDVAEIADDRVSTVDLRSGIKRAWREWEVELTGDHSSDSESRTALLDRIEASLLATGAAPSKYLSKLGRALGRTSLQ